MKKIDEREKLFLLYFLAMKELQRPYSFAERKILIQDEILYIPEYYTDFSTFHFPTWSNIFKNNHPTIIEYCAGNGKWICEKARAFPQFNWVAVEKRFDRVSKIWLNKQTSSLSNLFIICSEGYVFTTNYVLDGSTETVYINFPDPWPKTKHTKHRIMHEGFKQQLFRILSKDGKIILTTDDHIYLKKALALMEDCFILNQLIEDPKFFGDSYFSMLWQKMGRKIYYAEFGKR